VDPAVAPDESFMIFGSSRAAANSIDQARRDVERIESWDNGQYNVWRVPLAPWLGHDRSDQSGN
jgi:hypothetical protein